jgi:hypothetical protein
MKPEHERSLLDRVDEELRQALDVAPSPEFLPRVRERVAKEASASRAWTLPWLMPVAAGVVAVIATVLFLLRQPAPIGSPATQPRSAASPAVAESPRPVPDVPVSAPEPPARPLVERPRPERASTEPEVLVPPGEEELIRRFVAALRTRRVDAAAVLTGDGQPQPPDLAIPFLEEILPLEMKPLTAGTDAEGVNR